VRVYLKMENPRVSGRAIMLQELRNLKERGPTFFLTVYGYSMIRQEIQLKKSIT
jgi:SOS-response transcriptional repressor LexA